MLQTLQYQFSAQCSPNNINVNDTTCPTWRVSFWWLARKPKLSSHRLGCQASSTSVFLTFRLSMLSAVFVFFCWCLSPEIRLFHLQSDVRFTCPNYFSLLITAKVSGEWSLMLSSLASNTFDIGVGVCEREFLRRTGKSYRFGRNYVWCFRGNFAEYLIKQQHIFCVQIL
jgi:hypothetical protein